MPRKPSPRIRRRTRLVLQHLGLAERIALRMARRLPAHVEVEDLTSSGVIGLMEAAERWNPKANDNFEAFAQYRIRGAMLDYLRSADTLSRDMRTLSKRLVKAAHDLETQLKREPSHSEIARHLGVSIEELFALKEKLTGSTVVGIDDAGPDLLERVADEGAENPFDITLRREQMAIIEAQVRQLPAGMQQVLSLYYVEGLNFKEIGKVMGVGESRACQVMTEAKNLLTLSIAGRAKSTALSKLLEEQWAARAKIRRGKYRWKDKRRRCSICSETGHRRSHCPKRPAEDEDPEAARAA